MRIGIDYRPALVNPTGIGRYVRELVRAMIELDFDEHLGLFGYTFSRSRYSRAELGLAGSRAELVRLPLPSRWRPGLLGRLGRGADDLVGGADVYHHTQFQVLPVRRAVEVATVYDCMYAYPDAGYMPAEAAARLLAAAKEQAARSARILVPSHYVGAEVVMTLGVPPGRVTVVELGCDHVARALPAALPPRPAVPYLLTVSRVDARKNHLRMLQAFELLVKDGLPHRWVIAGERGYGCEPFERALALSPARERVEWRERVADAELPLLYAQADCFLFASLNEGFGLPPLEAMACGAPVVTSAVTSMPEVCGDAAFLVEPTESERIFEAARRVLTEPEIASELRLRGRTQARKFTWRECAKRTLLAYKNSTERTEPPDRLRHTV
jgi:glycosyltransferase involved in cell wall biosynthesis